MYRKKLLFAGFGLLLFALIYIIAGTLSYVYILNKNASCTAEAIGTVVINSKTTTKTRNKTTTKTNFVISYEVDGKTYQSKYTGGTSKYEKGEKVEIKYNPDQPDIFTLKNDNLSQMIILIFIGIGLIVFAISIIVLKKGFQTRQIL